MKNLNEIIKLTKETESLKKEAYSNVKKTPEWAQYEEAVNDFKKIDSIYKEEISQVDTNLDTGDFKISVNIVVEKKFNLEKFKEENPELFEKYCEEHCVKKHRVGVKKNVG